MAKYINLKLKNTTFLELLQEGVPFSRIVNQRQEKGTLFYDEISNQEISGKELELKLTSPNVELIIHTPDYKPNTPCRFIFRGNIYRGVTA